MRGFGYVIWVLIKIKVPGEVTIADQPPTNRGPKGDNRGRVSFYPMLFCTEKMHSSSQFCIYKHKHIQKSHACTAFNPDRMARWCDMQEVGKRHGMGQWLHWGVPQSPHNRGSIADQSRIFRSNGNQVGKNNTLQMLCLIWEFDVLTSFAIGNLKSVRECIIM